MKKKKRIIGLIVLVVVLVVGYFVYKEVKEGKKVNIDNIEGVDDLIVQSEGHEVYGSNGKLIYRFSENEYFYYIIDNKYIITDEIAEKEKKLRIYDLELRLLYEEKYNDINYYLNSMIDNKLLMLCGKGAEVNPLQEGIEGNEDKHLVKQQLTYKGKAGHKVPIYDLYMLDMETLEKEKISNTTFFTPNISNGEVSFNNEDDKLTTYALTLYESYDEINDMINEKVAIYDVEGNEIATYYSPDRYKFDIGFRHKNNLAYKDGLYGYINADGSMGIDYQYKKADDFVNGYAKVEKTNGEKVLIDEEGKEYSAYIDGIEISSVAKNKNYLVYNERTNSTLLYDKEKNKIREFDGYVDTINDSEFLETSKEDNDIVGNVYDLEGNNLLDELLEEKGLKRKDIESIHCYKKYIEVNEKEKDETKPRTFILDDKEKLIIELDGKVREIIKLDKKLKVE